MNIILITACPSGMATTFLAARRLEQAAQRLGWKVHVEMHGELAPVEAATAEQIAHADLIVVAAEHVPAPERFEGKRLYQAPIAQALPDPDAFLTTAKREAPLYGALAATSQTKAPAAAGGQTIVAVTACPTGVAHTFMAAEALAEAGNAMGHSIRVETQGSVGAQDKLTEDEIAAANVVILACDIEVDPTRFSGKRVYRTSTGTALKKSQATIENALAQASVESAGTANTASNESKSLKEKGVYKHLLTGVSFMLPMVVAGGLLIALSFMFGIEAFEQEGTLAAALMQIGGGTAFALMIPVLAGYIAYSIADRPGIAPGMIGGMLAADIGMGIASFVARNKFSEPEREAGKASFVLGLCFISEGAIPFAAKDPLRVIPACIAGGAVTGALSMLVGAQLMAPHGGIFVLLIPNAITPPLLYLGAIVAGSLITGLSYAFIKRGAAQVAVAS